MSAPFTQLSGSENNRLPSLYFNAAPFTAGNIAYFDYINIADVPEGESAFILDKAFFFHDLYRGYYEYTLKGQSEEERELINDIYQAESQLAENKLSLKGDKFRIALTSDRVLNECSYLLSAMFRLDRVDIATDFITTLERIITRIYKEWLEGLVIGEYSNVAKVQEQCRDFMDLPGKIRHMVFEEFKAAGLGAKYKLLNVHDQESTIKIVPIETLEVESSAKANVAQAAPGSNGKAYRRFTWNGKRNDFGELVKELIAKGWIEDVKPGDLRGAVQVLCNAFDFLETPAEKRKGNDPDAASTVYQYLKPGTDGSQINTKRRTPKFNDIKPNLMEK